MNTTPGPDTTDKPLVDQIDNDFNTLLQCSNRLVSTYPTLDPNQLFARLEAAPDLAAEEAKIINECKHNLNGGNFDDPIDSAPPAKKLKPNTNIISDQIDNEQSSTSSTEITGARAHIASDPAQSVDVQLQTDKQSCSNSITGVSGTQDDQKPGTSGFVPNGKYFKHETVKCGDRLTNIYGFGEDQKRVFVFVGDMYPGVDVDWLTNQLDTVYRWAPDELVEDLLAGTRKCVFNPKTSADAQRTSVSKLHFLPETGGFNPERFLLMFPDPFAHFNNTSSKVNDVYYRQALAELKNAFRDVLLPVIMQCFKRSKHHFYPSAVAIRKLTEEIARGSDKTDGSTKPLYLDGSPRNIVCSTNVGGSIDETLHYELLLWDHEPDIYKFIQDRKTRRDDMLKIAREQDLFETCQICFEEECLSEDMVSCYANGHQFCKECVIHGAKVAIDERQPRMKCMFEKCDSFYPDSALRHLLSPLDFDNFDRVRANVELKQAELENLESCEFCDFVIIMPDPNDKILKCLNPSCLKQTCRQCRKQSHTPLTCKEVSDEKSETTFRTYIENQMAEAMIRTCPKCSNRIIKLDGCNRLTCPCGAHMCYVCREQLNETNPYGHFNDGSDGGCPLTTTDKQVHEDVAVRAGNEARAQFLEENPTTAATMRHKNVVSVKNLAK